MNHAKKRVGADLQLNPFDVVRLNKFLSSTGRKRAPWITQLVLRELDAFDAIRSGKTQATVSLLDSLRPVPVAVSEPVSAEKGAEE